NTMAAYPPQHPAGAPLPQSGGHPNEASSSGYQPNRQLQQTRAQVDEVVDIMRLNVEKVLDRDAKISSLDDRAAELSIGSQQFVATTTRIQRKYFWQNVKMMIIIGVIVAILIIIIIVAIANK
ncbi:hypothetical protein BOX15_Mlig010677g1, partial [Macrostomum lignano]